MEIIPIVLTKSVGSDAKFSKPIILASRPIPRTIIGSLGLAILFIWLTINLLTSVSVMPLLVKITTLLTTNISSSLSSFLMLSNVPSALFAGIKISLYKSMIWSKALFQLSLLICDCSLLSKDTGVKILKNSAINIIILTNVFLWVFAYLPTSKVFRYFL